LNKKSTDKQEIDMDVGFYNKDQDEFKRLIQNIYHKYPGGVTLTPEYAEMVDKNLLFFFD